MKFIAGNAHPALAKGLARELKAPLVSVEIGAFLDGEAHERPHCATDLPAGWRSVALPDTRADE
jgi:hypothetical protein